MKLGRKRKRMITIELPAADIRNFDSRSMLERAKELDVQTVVLFANSYVQGFVYYDSCFAQPHPDLGKRDLFGEQVKIAREMGFEVIAYFNTKFNGKHLGSTWRSAHVRPDGTTPVLDNSVMMCPNGTYFEYIKHLVSEVCSKYAVDGAYIDELSFQGWCQCEYCRKKYRDMFNEELPLVQDWNDSTWKRFIKWRYQCITELAAECMRMVKESCGNEAKVFFQGAFPMTAAPSTGAAWYNWRSTRDCDGWHLPMFYAQSREMMDMEDIIGIEDFRSGMDQPFWWIGLSQRYVGCLGEWTKPVVNLLEYPYFPWLLCSLPEDEIRLVCAESVANGGSPWFPMYAPGLGDERGWDAIGRTFRFIEEKKEFLEGTESLAQVAIVYSWHNADVYGQDDAGSRYLDCVTGMYKVCLEEHIQVDIIPASFLANGVLERYDALVLPNLACMSDEQIRAVTEFVENGGGLVLTYETSFYDDEANLRDRPGLADLLGIDWSRDFTSGEAAYLSLTTEHVVGKGLGHKLVPYLHNQPKVNVVASHSKSICSVIPGPENMYAPAGEEMPLAGCIVGDYGKGRFVYFVPKLDATYRRSEFSDVRKIIANAIRWVMPQRLHVQLEAPSTVEMVSYAKDNSVIVHLVNGTGEGEERFRKVIPRRNITVLVSAMLLNKETDYEAISLVSDEVLRSRMIDGYWEITIPEVDVYEVICLRSNHRA